MNQKSWMTVALVLLSAVAARSALAVDPGWYAGANIGWSTMNDDVNNFSIKDNSFGWKVLGGYRMNEYFGVEGTYARVGKYEDGVVDLKLRGFTVEAVGYLPLSPTWDAYGKLGAFFWDTDASVGALAADGDGTDLVGGVGARFKLTDQYGVVGEWERYASDQSANLWSVGVDFTF